MCSRSRKTLVVKRTCSGKRLLCGGWLCGDCFAPLRTLLTNFVELREGEVRRMPRTRTSPSRSSRKFAEKVRKIVHLGDAQPTLGRVGCLCPCIKLEKVPWKRSSTVRHSKCSGQACGAQSMPRTKKATTRRARPGI